MILNCGCLSDTRGNTKGAAYQDAHYGTGKRVGTPLVKDNKHNKEARCTVCGKEQ